MARKLAAPTARSSSRDPVFPGPGRIHGQALWVATADTTGWSASDVTDPKLPLVPAAFLPVPAPRT